MPKHCRVTPDCNNILSLSPSLSLSLSLSLCVSISVSLSLPLLHSKENKAKILSWFETLFIETAGEDQLLQPDEFKKALGTDGVYYYYY